MGLSLDTSLQIAGYRASVLRDGLRGYMRTRSRANMLDLKSVFPHRKDGAILLEECLDRGLFDRATSTITPAGQTIAEAKVTPRAPRAKAQAVLESFLERAQRLERAPDAVSRIEEIWLFGSVLRGEETVGDIDLALSTARCERFQADPEARRAHVDAMLARHGKGLASPEECWKKEARLERYALFGERRHPLLSGARTDFLDLAALAVPCQLIYDRKRGGRVDDPILPRHPTSEGRSPDIVPLALLPDLSPSPIRPMDVAWLAGFSRFGQIVPFDIYRGQLEAMRTLFSGRTGGLCAFTDGCDPGFMEWVPDRAKQAGLDGRTAALLISAQENGDTSLVLNRRMDLDAARWTLHAGFDDVEFFRSRRKARPAPASNLGAIVALALATDIEHMLRRAAEADGRPAVALSIATAGLGSVLGPELMPAVLTALGKLLAPPSGLSKGSRPSVPPAWYQNVDVRVE